MKTAEEILKKKFVNPDKCDWYVPVLECIDEYVEPLTNALQDMISYAKTLEAKIEGMEKEITYLESGYNQGHNND